MYDGDLFCLVTVESLFARTEETSSAQSKMEASTPSFLDKKRSIVPKYPQVVMVDTTLIGVIERPRLQ